MGCKELNNVNVETGDNLRFNSGIFSHIKSDTLVTQVFLMFVNPSA